MKQELCRDANTLNTLAVVRSQNFSPRRRPLLGAQDGQNLISHLEMVTTFTYKPSLVRIDARNFELSWLTLADPPTNTARPLRTDRTNYNTLHRS